MILYAAPLEGVTTYMFRKAHAERYGGIDKYFIPFIEPHPKRSFTGKEQREISLENNAEIPVVPQVLTNSAQGFLDVAEVLVDAGYTEVNLNLGCPSGTVVPKGRGAGMLADRDALDRFLEEVFDRAPCPISVKTRIGRYKPEEFVSLVEIYNKYPISELIIHPRTREDFYKNTPHLEMFRYAVEHCTLPLCYNGDIFTYEDYQNWKQQFPTIERLMLGRGLVGEPQLAEEIKADASGFDKERFYQFHNAVYQAYRIGCSGDKQALMKMKELWFYMQRSFPGNEKLIKKLKKTNVCAEYEQIVKQIIGS